MLRGTPYIAVRCLAAGLQGCGRYKAAHAYDHWQTHSHCYALELETQRVRRRGAGSALLGVGVREGGRAGECRGGSTCMGMPGRRQWARSLWLSAGTQCVLCARVDGTAQVWDYAGDNYVHRLIQSKTDGKLVEVPTPGGGSRCGACVTSKGGRGTSRGS